MLRSGVAPLSRPLIVALFIAALVAAFGLRPALAANADFQLRGDPALINLISAEQALLDLTNADRVAEGLDPLEFDPDTLTIARQRAASQLGTPHLSHYDAAGDLVFVHLLGDAQLAYQLAGENLARSSTADPDVPQRIEQALMQSASHRQNILEKSFKRLSIGAATNAKGQIAFAEVYRT
jgi:uncharacterized protein YkwD